MESAIQNPFRNVRGGNHDNRPAAHHIGLKPWSEAEFDNVFYAPLLWQFRRTAVGKRGGLAVMATETLQGRPVLPKSGARSGWRRRWARPRRMSLAG